MSNRFIERVEPAGGGGGGGGSALTSVDTGRTAWVDQVNGDDATGQVGRLDLPFLTVQAALDAVYTTGDAQNWIIVLPGDYAEDVAWPTSTSSKRLGILGAGIESVRIRALQVEPPDDAAESLFLHVRGVSFTGEVGGQTADPLAISPAPANQGSLTCRLDECRVVNDDDAFVGVSMAAAAGGPTLSLRDTDVLQGSNVTDATAVSVSNGTFSLWDGEIAAVAEVAIVIAGDGTVDIGQATIRNTGTDDLVTSASTGTALTFTDTYFVTQGAAVNISTTQDLTIRGWGVITSSLSAVFRIVMGGGTLVRGQLGVDDTVFPRISGAGSIFDTEGFDPNATDLVATDMQALGEELVRGRQEVSSRFTSAGPHAVSATARVHPCDNIALFAGVDIVFDLPAISTVGEGKEYTFKDATGGATIDKQIIVNANGTETIDGAASQSIITAFGSITIVAEASGNWMIV